MQVWAAATEGGAEEEALAPPSSALQGFGSKALALATQPERTVARAHPQGNINMINAAIKKGVKKFVLVTSLGCGNTKDAIGEKV